MICLGFSIDSALKLEQRFDPTWFVPSTTHLSKYLDIRKQYYPTQGFEAGLYVGNVNYTHEITKLRDMAEKLQNDTFMANNVIAWVDPFKHYVKSNFHKDIYAEAISENEFNLYISKFLFSPKGASYQGYFHFEKELECGIPATKIIVRCVGFSISNASTTAICICCFY